MKARLEKFSTGMKRDPLDTLQRVIRFIIHLVRGFFESLLLYLYRVLVFPLPNRTKSGLKYALHPRVRLDYSRHTIFLNADSELSIRRARACEKEPETVAWIENSLQPGAVLYDVGANVGAYSLVASKFLGGKVAVYAIEPGFSTFDQLCRNVVLNNCQDSVHPLMLALNDSTGLVGFAYHSLEAGDAEHALTDHTKESSSAGAPVYNQQILGYRLDDLIKDFNLPSPTHIKLDVDGSELAVLRGASETLKSDITKSILVEVRKQNGYAEQVHELLLDAGFELVSEHDRGDGIIWNRIYRNVRSIKG